MITVNGSPLYHREGRALLALLQELGYRQDVIAVEYNGCVLDKGAYASTLLHDGDKIEVVSFVGGG